MTLTLSRAPSPCGTKRWRSSRTAGLAMSSARFGAYEVVGSVALDLMTWRDIDVYVEVARDEPQRFIDALPPIYTAFASAGHTIFRLTFNDEWHRPRGDYGQGYPAAQARGSGSAGLPGHHHESRYLSVRPGGRRGHAGTAERILRGQAVWRPPAMTSLAFLDTAPSAICDALDHLPERLEACAGRLVIDVVHVP